MYARFTLLICGVSLKILTFTFGTSTWVTYKSTSLMIGKWTWVREN